MLDAYAAGVFRLMVPGRGTVRPARDRVCAAGARSRPMLLELIRAAPDPEWTPEIMERVPDFDLTERYVELDASAGTARVQRSAGKK